MVDFAAHFTIHSIKTAGFDTGFFARGGKPYF